MKRIGKSLAALVLALVMSLTLLPVQAMAVEGDLTGKGGLKTVYTGEYVNPLYADALGAETSGWSQLKTSIQWVADVQTVADEPYLTEAETVKELQRQMIAREESITINVRVPSGAEDLQKKIAACWQDALAHTSENGSAGDYLRWQYAGYKWKASRSNGTDWKVTFTAATGRPSIWYSNKEQEQQLTSYIQSTILPQLALDGKTTYQKVKAIYDWITRNVRYDTENKNNDSYYLKYTAYAAAINKKAVCQGYTNLFYRLANDAGIDCRIITGGNHAWNIVRMDDGKYYCMDATYDEGRSSYSYFLKGWPEFSKTHSPQTDPQNTPYWTAYKSKMSDTDYNAAPVVPKPTVPANVTLVSAKAVSGGIQVTWEKAAGAATYNVYRMGPGDTCWKVVSVKQSGTSYTDKNVTAGSTYKYTVRGVAADGKTLSPGFNNTGVSATMPKPAAPANVTLTGAKAVSGGIQVTWQAASGAATYNVYRIGPGDTSWKVVSVKQSGTSYTDKNVTAGSTYKYTVRGVAADGKTLSPGFNNTGVSATMPKPVTAPANVTLTGAKAVSGGIQVTWEKAANAATYNVYRMGPGDTYWKVVSAKQSGTSYTDKNVTAGNTYKYTVRGVASDGKTLSPGFNNTGVSATMPKPVTAPANVTLTGAKAVSGGIQVTWQKVANAATYNVYRMGPGDTYWKVVSAKQSGTSYTDKNVTAGNTYKYTVRGVASDGKTLSPGFNNTGVSATAVPANVTLMSAKADTAGILVTWQKAAGAATYNVYRKGPGDTYWKVVSAKQSGTSYTDKNVTAGSTYKYTVRGVAADGKTLSPGYDKTGVSATATPARVALMDAKRITTGTKGIQVRWKSAANAQTYNVYRAANPPRDKNGRPTAVTSGWKLVGKQVNGLSFKDTTGQSGVIYAYTVRGVAADGKTLSAAYNKDGVRATMP